MPAISIIVPVYQVKNYLPRCIDSLIAQTFEDIEIILVDDASSDGSGEICDAYAKKDPRIRVIHQEHGGLSVARNTGLAAARGEWLMFVDSDDYVLPDFCRRPYQYALEQGADLVMMQSPPPLVSRRFRFHASGPVSQTQALDDLISGQTGEIVWNKLYKRSLFRSIVFPPHRLAEDMGTIYLTILNASNIHFLSENYYLYTADRPDSLTHANHLQVRYDALYWVVKRYLDIRSRAPYLITTPMRQQICDRIVDVLIHIDHPGMPTQNNPLYRFIAKKGRHPGFASPKRFLMYYALRISPSCFDLICQITKRRTIAPPND